MAIRERGGYAILVDPEHGVTEWDTFTCFHCQRIVDVAGGQDIAAVSGGCRVCGKFICLPCVNIGKCTPWETQMERMEARDRFLRSAGIVG